MPIHMQQVMIKVTTNDWFNEYKTLNGTGLALDNIAARIRFKNQFSGCIEDITTHYPKLEEIFLNFFPELIAHVEMNSIEINKT